MLTDEEFDAYWMKYCKVHPNNARRVSAFVYEHGDLILDAFNAYIPDRKGDWIAWSTFMGVMVWGKLINLGSLQALTDLENFIKQVGR